MTEIQQRLFAMQESAYGDFQAALMPTVPRDTVIGVRVPNIRALAKSMSWEETESFFAELPHRYYEENILHAALVEKMKDASACLGEIERFLPYVDNWAVCDMMNPKALKKAKGELMERVLRWLKSEHCYTVRFGISMLMAFYLDEDFSPEQLALVADIHSEEYYVRMMQAWYFATALAKQYDAALPYILDRRMEQWTHNKAIQKCVESRRISDEQKAYLKTLKYR